MVIDIFKKTVLAGIGAAVVTRQSTEKVLNDLVEKGRLTSDEARETTDKLIDEGRKEFDRSREEFSRSVEAFLAKANLSSRSELDALADRVAALEKAIQRSPVASDASAPSAGEPGCI